MGVFTRKSIGRAGTERTISFLISPSWGARTLHWSLPVWAARLCAGSLVVLLLALALGVGHYGMVLADAQETESLREENAKLRRHYQMLVTLETELASLAEELSQLRLIAGLEVYEDPGHLEAGSNDRDEVPN